MQTVNLKALKRTSRVIDLGTWGIILGVVAYSLMTSTPLVAAHAAEGWESSGPILGIMTDIAFIIALQSESFLARHGVDVSELGKWPAIFRWFTGLFTTFLNVWSSVAKQDWTGVAIHAGAPAILLLVAEAGPKYRAAMAKLVADAEARVREDAADSQVTATDSAPVVEPVAQTPVQTAPVVPVVVQTEDTDMDEAVQMANSGRTPKPSKADIKGALAKLADKGVSKRKDIEETLAGQFGVSTRTVRRWISDPSAA